MNLHPIRSKKRCLKSIKQEKLSLDVSDSEIKCKESGAKCIKNGKEKNVQQRFKC